MFNKKKKIISELRSEVEEKQEQIWELQGEKVKLKIELDKVPVLESVIANKDAEIQSLKQKLNGERVCSDYCSACEHGIPVERTDQSPSYLNGNPCVAYPIFVRDYICAFNAKCKDFRQKQE